MTVVFDHGDSLALWFPWGTPWKAPTTPRWRHRQETRGERLAECLALREWVLVDREWDVSTLCLFEAHAAHAVWVSWLPNGDHFGWYVNLQEPFVRTDHALQTMDLMLDIVVSPDRSWRWKDEDELAAFVARGVFDEAKAEGVRSEGLRVLDRLETNQPPFCDPWPEWRPHPAWDAPRLPSGWNRL